jgi:hypothetical protein
MTFTGYSFDATILYNLIEQFEAYQQEYGLPESCKVQEDIDARTARNKLELLVMIARIGAEEALPE